MCKEDNKQLLVKGNRNQPAWKRVENEDTRKE